MKKATKILALLLCAVLLVVGSVAGTLAYLTSKDAVTNTFTVGNVTITLDEQDVDTDTNKNDNVTIDGVDRDKANAYKLLPGKEYIKDPIVHVDEDSENCWVFVKVQNGIAAIEGDNKIADQIADNGWTAYTVEGVYYKQNVVGGTDLPVFEKFTIADSVTNNTLATYKDAEIVVTAYAVQTEEVDDVVTAWNAVKDLT